MNPDLVTNLFIALGLLAARPSSPRSSREAEAGRRRQPPPGPAASVVLFLSSASIFGGAGQPPGRSPSDPSGSPS